MKFITNESDLNFKWAEYPIQGLYFYIPNMPFHQKMIVTLSNLKEIYSQIDFYAVDSRQFVSQCIRFSVTSVPTLVALKYSGEVNRIENSVSTQDFVKLFADICTL